MPRKKFPIYQIGQVADKWKKSGLLTVSRFGDYLKENHFVHGVHKHSFYHFVFFTGGSGKHVIDFEQFTVKKGMIYFMRPGQVHTWQFKGTPEGYIVNFSAELFQDLLMNTTLITRFPFFHAGADVVNQVMILPDATQEKVTALMESMVSEHISDNTRKELMIALLLLELFILVEREYQQTPTLPGQQYNSTILQNFQQLIEENFASLRLPKEYAALLYVTPSHLNALTKEFTGMSAGELIRNRVLLEAKRLLVNLDLTINEISGLLNFSDSAYFTRFFKKYTGQTPEAFRNRNRQR